MSDRDSEYRGPAIFSYGFRPFFLAAVLLGLCVIPVWLLIWRGVLVVDSPFTPTDWHVHEMVFGYASAAIAGFLFTAVPNWTGRKPVRGWPLAVLLGLWTMGRLASSDILPGGATVAMIVDCSFLLSVVAMITFEIITSRNWRNLLVVALVFLLFTANALFHVETMMFDAADYGLRLGLSVIILLIVLIGGRIIPNFTGNWLAKRGRQGKPVSFNRFDGLCLIVTAASLFAWVVAPETEATAGALAASGALGLLRITRWRTLTTWRSPLLLMLHVAYLFVPLGFLAIAAAAFGLIATTVGAHLLGVGGVGGMTIAVMIRATRGHTGRDLVAGSWLTAAFGILVTTAFLRAFGHNWALIETEVIALSAGLWTSAFLIIAVRLSPWLILPSAAR